jgi:pilus assembly protein CpaC
VIQKPWRKSAIFTQIQLIQLRSSGENPVNALSFFKKEQIMNGRLFFGAFLVLSIAGTLWGAEEDIHLTLGESKLLHLESAEKVAIANPSVASVTPVSDDEILISAKAPGSTNLVLISPGGDKETRQIFVTSHNLKKAMVEIGVEVMEIDYQSSLMVGLSWGSVASQGASASSGSPTSVPNNFTLNEGNPPSVFAFGTVSRDALTASLQLLVNKGKAKILAKPKLLAVSGSEASFLSGGEVPYIVDTKLGSVDVQWKPYGVKLNIRPEIDAEGNIASSIRAEVSSVDTTNGLNINNTVIPALKTRWAETSVYMKSGSTMVIAGLISEQNQKFTSGIPLLSDIPLLGELFRSTNDQTSQSELVIFVTPTLLGETETNS